MSAIVKYAGFDPHARKPGTPTCHTLFALGHDTANIAVIKGMPEHIVLRKISNERSRVRGLPSPYEARA